MSSRRQHIEEMRFALAHNVTLPEAKRRLARRRQIEADEFLANLQNCGTQARPADEVLDNPSKRSGRTADGQPWMMRG